MGSSDGLVILPVAGGSAGGTGMSAAAITPELIAQHQLTGDGVREDRLAAGPRAELHRAGHLQRDVERALLLQELAPASEEAAHARQAGAAGPGRERRHHRHRRRLRHRLQDRIAQSPQLHRAVPGRGHRRRRHPARHLHHGRAAHRRDGRAALRAASTIRPPARATGASSKAWSPASRITATASASPPWAASAFFEECYNGNPLVNVFALGVFRKDEIFLRQGGGRRQPGDLRRRQDRPRRHSRRVHGVGRVHRGVQAEAAQRAGGRSVPGEAAARSLPRSHADGRHRRHSGHGRGRPHLLHLRDGQPRREPASRSTCSTCRSAKPA